MDTLLSSLGLLLAFPLIGLACTPAADEVLVPDQVSSAQGRAGSAGALVSMSSATDSNMAGRAPARPEQSAAVQPAHAAVSGSAAGSQAPRPDVAATAGSAGSREQTPAASAGMGGSTQIAGRSSDMTPARADDADCDFNGVWIAKQLTVSEALGLPQTSNSWLYLEFQQTGHDLVVTKSLECGIEVQGTATVTLSRATLEAALLLNSQVGRKATLEKLDGKCAFQTGRFWKIRGADEQRFLPKEGRDSMRDIAQVAADNPLPTTTMTDGAVDTEGDGKLGMAFQVSGVITGVRNSVQREWSVWFSAPGFEIEPSTDWTKELSIRADFDNEESILDPASGLLAASGVPSRGATHQLKLRFLGRDLSDPRARALIKANDLDTCYAIQDAMKAEAL